jgi:hypothetical protein
MSEVENSTLVESAMEMQSAEGQPENIATEIVTSETTATVSNQEAMIALTLGRIKRQSEQIERVGRLLGQVPVQLRGLEGRQSRQVNLVGRQVRALQLQVRQLQKQVARIKIDATSARKSTRKTTRRTKGKRR